MAQTNPDESDFVVFESPEMGIRAAAKILQAYEESHGINTLEGIINRWAPPSENDTGGYVQAVEIWADVSRDDVLSMTDYDTVYRLLRAMTRMENGRPVDDENAWYPKDVWERGLRLGGLVPSKPLTKSRTVTGGVAAATGSAAAIGIITDALGLPPEVAAMLPTALTGMAPEHVALIAVVVSALGSLYTLYARRDDKLKGRL